MTIASKEPVSNQQLKAFKQIQRKVFAPLPVALLQQADGAAFRTLSEKAQLWPGFIDFHPLETVNWQPAASVEVAQERSTEGDIKRRMVSAFKNKPDNHPDTNRTRQIFRSLDKSTATPQKLSLVNSGHKIGNPNQPLSASLKSPTPAQTGNTKSAFNQGLAAALNTHRDAGKATANEAGKEASKESKTGSIKNNTPERLQRQSVPQILATLLNSIDSLNQALSPTAAGKTPNSSTSLMDKKRGPAANQTGIGKSARENISPVSTTLTPAGPRFSERNNNPSQGGTSRSASIAGNTGKSAQKNKQNIGASSLDTLDALINQLWLFSNPKDGLSNTVKRPSGTANSEDRQALTGEADNPGSRRRQGLTSSKSISALEIPELRVEVNEHPPEVSPTPPSYHQAEELAEQVNRVLREQAWLRGVNLP